MWATRVTDMARRFIIYDTETTGLKMAEADLSLPSALSARGDEVCQIGGIIADENMVPTKLFCHYCDTVKVECDKGALRANQISMKEVRQYVRGQFLPSILTERIPEFLWNDSIFIGYNVEFDMNMVKQTVSNADVQFDWEPLRGSIIPKHGRVSIDVSTYFMHYSGGGRTYHTKLSSFDAQLAEKRAEFYRMYGNLDVETNCQELFIPSWNRNHSAFYDALNTYLLWRDTVWRKKLV